MIMCDFNAVKAEAKGKWPGIYSALGIDVGDGRHGKCPMCGHKDNFRCDDKGIGAWICTCGAGDGWKLLQEVLGCDFRSAIEQVSEIVGKIKPSKYAKEKKTDPASLRKLFLESSKIEPGDLAHDYLKGRGLNLFPAQLRYIPKCWELETKKDQHAMLAVVRNPDGTAVTIHRTYLDILGGKLAIEKPKKIMPGIEKIVGGAIRLFEPAEHGTLGIAEGIETAIECTDRFAVPTWSAINSTMLEHFIPPQGIKKMFVFGDNDKNFAGQKAAYVLANRLVLKHKVEVEVIIPSEIGDWLDIQNKKCGEMT